MLLDSLPFFLYEQAPSHFKFCLKTLDIYMKFSILGVGDYGFSVQINYKSINSLHTFEQIKYRANMLYLYFIQIKYKSIIGSTIIPPKQIQFKYRQIFSVQFNFKSIALPYNFSSDQIQINFII